MNSDHQGGSYSPHDEGWQAHQQHKRLTDNPWAINNWKHYDWEQGWIEADGHGQIAAPSEQPDNAKH